MICPDCGGILVLVKYASIVRDGIREEVIPPVHCFNLTCNYIGLSADFPFTMHPGCVQHRTNQAHLDAVIAYSRVVSLLIPETEIDLARCGGAPVFTKSRLPIITILLSIDEGETDEDIMNGYPRMTLYLLGICRKIVESLPIPKLAKIS